MLTVKEIVEILVLLLVRWTQHTSIVDNDTAKRNNNRD